MRSIPQTILIAIVLLLTSAIGHGVTVEVVLNGHGPRQVQIGGEGVLPTLVSFDAWTNRAVVPLVVFDPSARPTINDKDVAISELPEPPDRPRAIGPDAAVLGDDAYVPTIAWRPGAGDQTRRRVVLAGVLVTLAMVACTLLRGRRAALGTLVAVSLASSGAIAWWQRAQPDFVEADGSVIVVRRDGSIQHDRWRYFTTRRDVATLNVALATGATPVFSDAEHAKQVIATIRVDARTGGQTLVCTLRRGARVAVMERSIRGGGGGGGGAPPVATSQTSRRSSIGELARRLYVGPNGTVRGEVEDPSEQFGAIVLEERDDPNRH
jgi:hypothetical protein